MNKKKVIISVILFFVMLIGFTNSFAWEYYATKGSPSIEGGNRLYDTIEGLGEVSIFCIGRGVGSITYLHNPGKSRVEVGQEILRGQTSSDYPNSTFNTYKTHTVYDSTESVTENVEDYQGIAYIAAQGGYTSNLVAKQLAIWQMGFRKNGTWEGTVESYQSDNSIEDMQDEIGQLELRLKVIGREGENEEEIDKLTDNQEASSNTDELIYIESEEGENGNVTLTLGGDVSNYNQDNVPSISNDSPLIYTLDDINSVIDELYNSIGDVGDSFQDLIDAQIDKIDRLESKNISQKEKEMYRSYYEFSVKYLAIIQKINVSNYSAYDNTSELTFQEQREQGIQNIKERLTLHYTEKKAEDEEKAELYDYILEQIEQINYEEYKDEYLAEYKFWFKNQAKYNNNERATLKQIKFTYDYIQKLNHPLEYKEYWEDVATVKTTITNPEKRLWEPRTPGRYGVNPPINVSQEQYEANIQSLNNIYNSWSDVLKAIQDPNTTETDLRNKIIEAKQTAYNSNDKSNMNIDFNLDEETDYQALLEEWDIKRQNNEDIFPDNDKYFYYIRYDELTDYSGTNRCYRNITIPAGFLGVDEEKNIRNTFLIESVFQSHGNINVENITVDTIRELIKVIEPNIYIQSYEWNKGDTEIKEAASELIWFTGDEITEEEKQNLLSQGQEESELPITLEEAMQVGIDVLQDYEGISYTIGNGCYVWENGVTSSYKQKVNMMLTNVQKEKTYYEEGSKEYNLYNAMETVLTQIKEIAYTGVEKTDGTTEKITANALENEEIKSLIDTNMTTAKEELEKARPDEETIKAEALEIYTPTQEEWDAALGLYAEAVSYERFYSKAHKKDDNGIELYKKAELNSSATNIIVDQENKSLLVGPFSVDYLQGAIAKFNRITKVNLAIYDEEDNETIIENPVILDENFQTITMSDMTNGNNPELCPIASNQKFYLRLDNIENSEKIKKASVKVEVSTLVRCNGTLTKLNGYNYSIAEVSSNIESIEDGDGNITGYTYDIIAQDAGTYEEQPLIAINTKEEYEVTELTYEVSIPDKKEEEIKWQFTLKKEDENGKAIKGARFKILVAEDETYQEPAYYLYTDSTGVITLPIKKKEKDTKVRIVIQEKEVPEGYVLDDSVHIVEFDVTEDGIQNQKITTSKENVADNMKDEIDIDNSGKVVKRVTLTVKNKTEPYDDGDDDDDGGGGGGGTTIVKDVKEGYSLELIKIDEDKNQTLDGATFKVTLTNGRQTEPYQDITYQGGSLTIPNLMMSGDITATIQEIEAPEGHQKILGDMVVKFKVNESSSSKTYYSGNTKITENRTTYQIEGDITLGDYADYIKTAKIYNDGAKISLEIDNDPEETPKIKTTMDLAGFVWEEGGSGKEHDSGNMLDCGEEDINTIIDKYLKGENTADELKEALDNIDSIIDGVLVNLYDTNNELLQTTVSRNGQYIFHDLDPMKKYKVKFIYNGQEYEDVLNYQELEEELQKEIEYNTYDWKVTSKAKEIEGNALNSRTSVNGRFSEIRSWPNNYVTTNSLGVSQNGYNRVYLRNQLLELKAELIDETIKYGQQQMAQGNKKYTLEEVYKKILEENSNRVQTEELNYKLQFLFDCMVEAETIENYPISDKFIIDDGYVTITDQEGNKKVYLKPGFDYVSVDGTEIKLTLNGEKYTPIYPGQYYINLGLNRRNDLNLQITSKELAEVEVQSNGKSEVFENNGTNKDQIIELRESEIFSNTYNGEGQEGKEFDIYVKYRIYVNNVTTVTAKITELVDYYTKDLYDIEEVQIQYRTEDRHGEFITYIDDLTVTEEGEVSKRKASEQSSYEDAKSNIEGFSARYIKIPAIELEQQESICVTVIYKLNDDGKSAFRENGLTEQIPFDNIVEINGYQTEEGIIDYTSIPGDITRYSKKMEELHWEDDSKQSETLIHAKQEAARTLSGIVYYDGEAVNTTEAKTIGETYTPIQGVQVELLELEKDINDSEKDNVAIKNIAKIWTGSEWTNAEMTTGENGEYNFTGYLPGNYIVKFTYNHESFYIDEEGTKYCTAEEYQSTYANPNINSTEYTEWYLNTEERYSDAYDEAKDRAREMQFFDEYRYKISDSIRKASNGESFVDLEIDGTKLSDALTMNAYTAIIKANVEYISTFNGMLSSQQPAERSYNIQCVDFGIAKRAETTLKIEKEVKDVTITLQNGAVLIDHATKENIAEQLVQYARQLPSEDLYFEIDDEILHGSTLQVTYQITVINESEERAPIRYYLENTADNINKSIAISYYNEPIEEFINYLGDSYYVMDHIEQDVNQTVESKAIEAVKEIDAKVRAKEIIDYVQSNYTFDSSLTEDNKNWEVVKVENIQNDTNQTLVANDLGIDLTAYQTIIKATEDNLLCQELGTGESATTTITLTKVLTPTEDLNFDNILEIVEVGSTQGITDHGATPGNLNPATEQNLGEHDASKAGDVVITDPTGENHSNYLAIVILISISILAVGIVLIKKYVIQK